MAYHRRALCRLGLAMLFACAASASAADPHGKLIIAISNETWMSPRGVWLELIYRDAFGRLGYDIEIRPYPNVRATAMVESGQADGELHRIASFAKRHPTLVRVAESHFGGPMSAYAISDLPVQPGWKGLEGGSYRVEYRAGTNQTETELPKVVAPSRLSTVYSTVLGLRKLLARRTDIYVDNEFAVNATLAQPEFRDSPIRRIAQMELNDAYAYLHPRNRELAPKLSAVLAEMKKAGLIERYRQQAATLPVPSALPVGTE